MTDTNTLNNLFFDKHSYKQLYELKEKGQLKYEFVSEREKSFIIMDKDEKIYLFFLNPICVVFQNILVDKKIKDIKIDNIYSSIQIEEYFKSLNISNPAVVLNGLKKLFSEAKINIEPFIDNNTLIIYNDNSSFENLKQIKILKLLKKINFILKN